MDQFVIALLSVLVLSIVWFIKVFFNFAKRTPPLPPGPRGLPILGYLPFLGKNLLHQFGDLARQYGPIYKLYLGNKLCVVINSPSLLKEVVRDQDSIFADRDANIAALTATYGGNDIAFSPHNSRWRAMRKIFVREVLSSSSLQASYSLRKDEVKKAIRDVYNNTGKRVQVGELSFRTELNVIMNMLWGGIVEGEEGQRVGDEFREVVIKLINLIEKPNIADFYPVLARFDIQGVKKEMEGYVQSLDRIFEDIIARYRKKLSGEIKKEGKKDFLQVLLELNEREDSEMSMSLTQIKALFVDIVAGGTDTTAATIEWAMAELLNNPKAMENVQNELSEMVGMNTEVEEFHIPKLKYLEAVLKETMRLHPTIPLSVPRSPTQTSIVGGYTIPKRTKVFINIGWIQRDPSIWDSPSEFKPDRFLYENKNCDFSGNNFHYLPFGSGRRICAGLPLAERMLMYLLASLLHSFEWKLPDGETVDMSDRFGIVTKKSTPLLAIPTPRLPEPNLYA
ncbi:cytochrome P450 76C4-like [Sesamum indicum]|uniref:Cytochrome P450 76C4-like n=1 Tax=Sesamum indicum TaxID=4182 RepID=A0A6I9STV8_SESIN|nr:cytochrome P450 76C4-like [Sesamum indicum]